MEREYAKHVQDYVLGMFPKVRESDVAIPEGHEFWETYRENKAVLRACRLFVYKDGDCWMLSFKPRSIRGGGG